MIRLNNARCASDDTRHILVSFMILIVLVALGELQGTNSFKIFDAKVPAKILSITVAHDKQVNKLTKQYKTSLNNYYDKRIVCDDSISTHAFGYNPV